jgi:alkylation response protein AidB-like acyl-CoA dehydrogenase
MDFSFTEDQLALKRSVSEFARQQLNDEIIVRDHAGTFPEENWRKCARFGIHGLPFPEEYGGTGLDALSTILAMEALGFGCRDSGLIFAINAQMWAVQTPLLKFGSPSQKEKYLPGLIRGDIVAAHAMTEPDSGSDSFALSTRAERQGEDYVLNGAKTFVTNAPAADLFLVFATVDKRRGFMGITAFLIEKGTEGLTVGPPIEKMGMRTSPMAEVVLQDCRVAADCRLGREGNGGPIFKHSMAWERTCILASAVGTMQRQLDKSIEYAKVRKQFGKTIGSFQAISHAIVEMKVRLETARLLLYRVGWLRAQGKEATEDVAMAKLYLSECFVRSSLDAVHIHGGYGYATEFEIERDLRDAIGSRIYSGTSEIQKELIARALGL